jgi:hypothetical protein
MDASKDEKKLYNSRIIDTYIKLIKSRYPFVNIAELLELAEMQPYEVADQGHWFTQGQVDVFHERASRLTGSQNLAREAGRYAASPEAIGVMRQYVLGMVGPAKVFELIRKTSANFTRSTEFESRKISAHKIEITVTPNPGVQEKMFQCENRVGFFEAVGMVFQGSVPQVEHTECIFKGGRHCRYVISWEPSRATTWQSARNNLVGLAALLGGLALYDPLLAVEAALPLSVGSALLFLALKFKREKDTLQDRLDNFKDSSDKLLEQINQNYNNALVTNEIGQAISRQTSIDDILASVVQVLEKRLDYDRGLILLANASRSKLMFRAGFGYPSEQISSCLLYTSPSPRDRTRSRMPSSA